NNPKLSRALVYVPSPRSISLLRCVPLTYTPRPATTTNVHTLHHVEFYRMSESEEFGKGIERIIDQMIARLPEDVQSGIRKQLAHQREVAWIARAEAMKAKEEQRRLEDAAKKAADSAEQELLKLLLN